jgi:hypothetical protein
MPFLRQFRFNRASAISIVFAALMSAGCRREAPSTQVPAHEPPCGTIKLGEPIPYAVLAEHAHFSTKSRVQLFRFQRQVVQVVGPVCKVESDGEGAILHLGTARDSCVRARFTDALVVKNLREGQEVVVTGTFTFSGKLVVLENAGLECENGTIDSSFPRSAWERENP